MYRGSPTTLWHNILRKFQYCNVRIQALLRPYKLSMYGAQNETYIEGWEKKGIKPIDIQKVVQNVSGWLCKTKRLRGFNLQLHLGAF